VPHAAASIATCAQRFVTIAKRPSGGLSTGNLVLIYGIVKKKFRFDEKKNDRRLRNPVFDSGCIITVSVAKCLQEQLGYGRVTRRAPMAVRKKMDRIGGHCFVEIDADIRKLAENRGGKTEPRHEEISRALMSQDYSCAARYFFADLAQEEADDCDRSTRIQTFRSRRLDDPRDD
jgi:hypothetical protein